MNGKYYPLPFKSEQARAQKYFDLMPDGVFSVGRAGSYLYRIDIDDTIEQAMDMAAKLRS
jgi:UDP-galactopyranose mutase